MELFFWASVFEKGQIYAENGSRRLEKDSLQNYDAWRQRRFGLITANNVVALFPLAPWSPFLTTVFQCRCAFSLTNLQNRRRPVQRDLGAWVTARLYYYRTCYCTGLYFRCSHRAELWRPIGLPGNVTHSLSLINSDTGIAYEDSFKSANIVVLKLAKLLREIASLNNAY